MDKHRILVPIDGSAFGRQIFPVLARFFQPESCELILLRVGEPVSGLIGTPPRPASSDGMVFAYDSAADASQAAHPIYASQQRESALADFVAEIQGDVHLLEAAGFTVRHDLRFGNRGEQIVDYVENHDIDMIAMTTHWRMGINRLLFGNTVQHITPRVRVPLLMLRPEEE